MILALNVIVLDEPGGNTHTSHVSDCPATVGCPTFGLDVVEFAIYAVPAGNVSVTIPVAATVPRLPYEIVYVTISHDTTTGLSTTLFDHRSIIPLPPVVVEVAVPQLLLL